MLEYDRKTTSFGKVQVSGHLVAYPALAWFKKTKQTKNIFTASMVDFHIKQGRTDWKSCNKISEVQEQKREIGTL